MLDIRPYHHVTLSKLYQNVYIYMLDIRPYHVTQTASNDSLILVSDTDGDT